MVEVGFSHFHAGVLIFIITLLGHGQILLNDGLYWDGWMIHGWFRLRDFKTMKTVCNEGGLPFFYYEMRLMASLPNSVFFYKLLSFISLFLSSFLIFCILNQLPFFTFFESLCISILNLCYPGQEMTAETSCIRYVYCLALFFLASYLGIKAEFLPGYSGCILKIAAIVVFLISFNMNSLLLYYFGFIFMLLTNHLIIEGVNIQNLFIYLIKNIFYLFPPFLYVIWKEVKYPRHSNHKDYNKITVKNVKQILRGIGALFNIGARGVYCKSISFLFKQPIIFIFVIIFTTFIIIYLYPQHFLIQITISKSFFLIIFGIILMICGGLPYIIIGQSFGLRGWETKNNGLLSFPMALILFGLINIFLKPYIAIIVFGILIMTCIFYLNYNYLLLLAVYVKNRSILFNLFKIPNAHEFSVFSVCDFHPIRFRCEGHSADRDGCFPEHRPAYLIYMFESLWRDGTRRIAINETELREESYTPQEVELRIKETLIDHTLQDIDPNGKQAQLIIRKNNIHRGELLTSFYYLIHRFFRSDKMSRFLSGLSHVELVSLK